MQTPDEWLKDFEAKVADLQQKTSEFKSNIESAGASERSADGSVVVTVAPNGCLTDLHLADSAMAKSASELATEILELSRAARQSAANGVADAFVPLGGDRDHVQRIPVPESDEPAAPAPAAGKRPETDEDDYSEEFVVYRDTTRW